MGVPISLWVSLILCCSKDLSVAWLETPIFLEHLNGFQFLRTLQLFIEKFRLLWNPKCPLRLHSYFNIWRINYLKTNLACNFETFTNYDAWFEFWRLYGHQISLQFHLMNFENFDPRFKPQNSHWTPIWVLISLSELIFF